MAEPEPTETEWQFDAPDLEVVDAWLRRQPAHAAVSLEDRGARTQQDTYHDTEGWHLTHSGYSLRVRAAGDRSEVTLKAFGRRDGGPVSRAEFNEPGDLTEVIAGDNEVGRRVRLVARAHALRPLFTVVTHRRRWDVKRGAVVLAEIAIDATEVESPGGLETLRRVEIEETTADGLEAIGPFVEALRTECGLEPATTSKFRAGLLAAGLDPDAPVLGPIEVDPDDRAADRAYALLRRFAQEFLAREGGTALGEDAEQLHQMRVATRRLRAALRVFDAVVPAPLMGLREELQWFAQALGAVRDLDVQIEHLEGLRGQASWAEATALAPLLARFIDQRDAARLDLLAAMDSPRYEAMVRGLRDHLLLGPPADAPETGSREEARRVIVRRYRRFREDARALRRDSPRVEFHQLRIRGKRLRYSLELFVDLLGQPGRRALLALRSLQDELGELQDLSTTDERLAGLVRDRADGLPPDTLVMVGRLMERHEDRAAAIIRTFPRSRGSVLRSLARLRRVLRPPRSKPEQSPPAPEEPVVPPAPPAAAPPAPRRVAPARPRGVLGALIRRIVERR